jgi:hypothetical protein
MEVCVGHELRSQSGLHCFGSFWFAFSAGLLGRWESALLISLLADARNFAHFDLAGTGHLDGSFCQFARGVGSLTGQTGRTIAASLARSQKDPDSAQGSIAPSV